MDNEMIDNEKTAYEMSEHQLIRNYGICVDNGIIYKTNKDLEKNSIKKKYDTWLRKLAELNPKEYDVSSITKLDKKLIIELALNIVVSIFGAKVAPEFLNYVKTIQVNNKNLLLDGMSSLIGIPNPETKVLEIHDVTFIPNIEYFSSVSIIIHEFIHYYIRIKKIDEGKKRYYNEILSLYAEKYSNQFIFNMTKDEGFLKKMESTRIEGILWHYYVSPNETEAVLKIYNDAKKRKDYSLIQELEKTFPYFKSPKGIEHMKGYRKCLADSYGIGYLFSHTLYNKGLEDQKVLREKLNSYFNSEINLEELLSYYGISTDNFKLYDDSYAYLKKVLK